MTEDSRAKAEVTRKANAAARKAAEAARWEQEQKDRALVLDVVRDVLKDPEATTGQRLYAMKTLEYLMGYHFTAYDVPFPGNPEDTDKMVEQFKVELDRATGKA